MKRIIDFLTKLLLIFVPKRFARHVNHETVSYLFFGGVTTVIGLGFYALFIWAGISASMSTNLSNIAAIIFAFFVNKLFVFESPSWRPSIFLPELWKFFASRAATFVLEFLAILLLVDVLGFHAFVMRLITMVVIQVIGNYALSKWVVFIKKEES